MLLSNARWRDDAIRLFKLPLEPGEEISDELKSKADHLVKILSRRFKSFLKRKIPNQHKREHWSMELAYDNLPVDACLMAMSGHLPIDLDFFNDADCLLNNDESCFVRCEEHPDREGGYLYFDLIRKVFIRSGKVVGRGFKKRDDEHLQEAKKITPSSKFYRRWPSRLALRESNSCAKGHFEHLRQLVAVGFDSDAQQLQYLDQDWTKGGILVLSERHQKHIDKSMNHLKCSRMVKYQHALGYIIELGYNLALAPDNDESDNPGFESLLGVFSSN